MRHAERIKELLDLVNEIWQKHPDLRFNQLIYNLQWGYSQKNGNAGQIKAVDSEGFARTGFDFFNLEDNEFLQYLKQVASTGEY